MSVLYYTYSRQSSSSGESRGIFFLTHLLKMLLDLSGIFIGTLHSSVSFRQEENVAGEITQKDGAFLASDFSLSLVSVLPPSPLAWHPTILEIFCVSKFFMIRTDSSHVLGVSLGIYSSTSAIALIVAKP